MYKKYYAGLDIGTHRIKLFIANEEGEMVQSMGCATRIKGSVSSIDGETLKDKLKNFKHILSNHDITLDSERFKAVATAGFRLGENSKEVLEDLKEIGYNVRIIDPKEEAAERNDIAREFREGMKEFKEMLPSLPEDTILLVSNSSYMVVASKLMGNNPPIGKEAILKPVKLEETIPELSRVSKMTAPEAIMAGYTDHKKDQYFLAGAFVLKEVLENMEIPKNTTTYSIYSGVNRGLVRVMINEENAKENARESSRVSGKDGTQR